MLFNPVAHALPRNHQPLNLTQRRVIGTLDGHACLSGTLVGPVPDGMYPLPLRQALLQVPETMVAPLVRARQLHSYDLSHRYCSACATPLLAHTHDIGKHCPSCNAHYYPQIAPAMMVLITRGDDLLLARSPHFTPGVYSALAGFVEAGESIEACIHREVAEEVGLSITRLRYVSSQSWPFPHSLMLAFRADYVAGDIVPQAGEIEHAAWFHRDNLPTLPIKASIAHHLIQHTLATLHAERT